LHRYRAADEDEREFHLCLEKLLADIKPLPRDEARG